MSDNENKLLERIAALEALQSNQRRDESKSAFDKKRAALDPIKYFEEQGLDTVNLTRHFVAHALGKDCPPHLSAMVQMGPQIAATSQLEELVTSLSRKVDSMLEKSKQSEVVASVKSTTVDPVKYPTLAAAIKTDPNLLESELGSIGTFADQAEALGKIENKLKPYAKAFGFKPTDTSAKPSESQATTVTETKPEFKPANNLGGEVTPLVELGMGAFSDEDHSKLKAAVLKKYSDVT